MEKATYMKIISNDLSPLFDSDIKAPIMFMELSKKQCERKHCFHTTGIYLKNYNSITKNTPSYHKATYGKDIS